MASPKRERKRLNKAAGRPVRIVVCAYPSTSIEPVMGLLKSAVLYGDDVVLHSPVASVLGSFSAVAQSGPESLLELLAQVGPGLDERFDAQMQELDTQHGRGSAQRIITELGNPRSLTRALLGQQLSAAGLDLDAFDAQLAGIQQDLGSATDEQLTAAGFDELAGAFNAGVLAVEAVELDDDLVGYQRQLEQLLNTQGVYPVFDDQLGNLVASMIEAGTVKASPHALTRGTQAATADRLLGSLPTFPLAKMDEIVDIREELRRPLINFRAEMIKATAELQLNALDGEFEDAAAELWFGRVAPALAELDEIARSGGLIRTYGLEAAKGLTVPAATAMIVGLSSGDWTTATVAGLANLGAAAVARGGEIRSSHQFKRRQNPYYFLHTTGHRLDG